MAFWDDLQLAHGAWIDTVNPVNWFTGNAPVVAQMVEEQQAKKEGRAVDQSRANAMAEGGLEKLFSAADETVAEVRANPLKPFTAGISALPGWVPWAAGGVALLLIAAIAAPYVGAAKGLVR